MGYKIWGFIRQSLIRIYLFFARIVFKLSGGRAPESLFCERAGATKVGTTVKIVGQDEYSTDIAKFNADGTVSDEDFVILSSTDFHYDTDNGNNKKTTEMFVRHIKDVKPDIVVMDLVMPRKDGIAATTELHEKLPESKVLILTTFSSSEDIAKALKAGATGAVLKSSGNDELIGAILKVARDERYLSADIEHLLEDDPPLPGLSPRQSEILESIARGLTNKEIAAQLEISLESVKSHIKIILEKLGAASRTEAASIAQRKRLLKS